MQALPKIKPKQTASDQRVRVDRQAIKQLRRLIPNPGTSDSTRVGIAVESYIKFAPFGSPPGDPGRVVLTTDLSGGKR